MRKQYLTRLADSEIPEISAYGLPSPTSPALAAAALNSGALGESPHWRGSVATRLCALLPRRSRSQTFGNAARRFASGVTVVTTRLEKTVHGATVSAFFTLSLEPLQVLVSLSTAGRSPPPAA